MLRKRTRSVQQDQPRAYPYMSVSDFLVRNDFRNQRAKKSSLFSVPGMFVGLIPKGLFDSEDARSPTSPLDYRVVSNVGGSCRAPKFWDCDKVGLRIINDSDGKAESGSKNVIFGPLLRIKASASGNSFDTSQASKSVPKNYPVFNRTKLNHSYNPRTRNPKCIFEIGDDAGDQLESELVEGFQSCSLDSSRRLYPMPSVVRRSNLGSNSNLGDKKFCSGVLAGTRVDSASVERGLKAGGTSQFCDGSNPNFDEFGSAADIELSEEFTCVSSHGPNPQKIHIYGDCILRCHSNFPNTSTSGLTTEGQCETTIHPVVKLKSPASLPSKDFLRFCYNCNKNLDGKDIFMYRGEKAFCSLECREPEIVNNEDSDETASKSSDDSPDPENAPTALLVQRSQY